LTRRQTKRRTQIIIMLKLIKNKIIQAVVKSDAFKLAVEDLAIKGAELYIDDTCDFIDKQDLDRTMQDFVWDNDIITSDNIYQYTENFVETDDINDHIDDRLAEKNLDELDIGFEVTKYCDENLSKNFLEHANALTKHFKVVVEDTWGKESNNG
jgi:hypothetical protein